MKERLFNVEFPSPGFKSLNTDTSRTANFGLSVPNRMPGQNSANAASIPANTISADNPATSSHGASTSPLFTASDKLHNGWLNISNATMTSTGNVWDLSGNSGNVLKMPHFKPSPGNTSSSQALLSTVNHNNNTDLLQIMQAHKINQASGLMTTATGKPPLMEFQALPFKITSQFNFSMMQNQNNSVFSEALTLPDNSILKILAKLINSSAGRVSDSRITNDNSQNQNMLKNSANTSGNTEQVLKNSSDNSNSLFREMRTGLLKESPNNFLAANLFETSSPLSKTDKFKDESDFRVLQDMKNPAKEQTQTRLLMDIKADVKSLEQSLLVKLPEQTGEKRTISKTVEKKTETPSSSQGNETLSNEKDEQTKKLQYNKTIWKIDSASLEGKFRKPNQEAFLQQAGSSSNITLPLMSPESLLSHDLSGKDSLFDSFMLIYKSYLSSTDDKETKKQITEKEQTLLSEKSIEKSAEKQPPAERKDKADSGQSGLKDEEKSQKENDETLDKALKLFKEKPSSEERIIKNDEKDEWDDNESGDKEKNGKGKKDEGKDDEKNDETKQDNNELKEDKKTASEVSAAFTLHHPECPDKSMNYEPLWDFEESIHDDDEPDNILALKIKRFKRLSIGAGLSSLSNPLPGEKKCSSYSLPLFAQVYAEATSPFKADQLPPAKLFVPTAKFESHIQYYYEISIFLPVRMLFRAQRYIFSMVDCLIRKKLKLEELTEEYYSNYISLLMRLTGEFTFMHSMRTTELAVLLAKECSIEDKLIKKQIILGCLFKDIGEADFLLNRLDFRQKKNISDFFSNANLSLAGKFHDIGKIRIPREILYKPGKLTEDEFKIMKMHPVYSESILHPVINLRYLCPIVRAHHERWDGNGYPDGIAGNKIPIASRIIAITDVFDALISDRPYKKGLPLEKAVKIMSEGKGTHFDPDLLEVFLTKITSNYCVDALTTIDPLYESLVLKSN